MSEFKRRPKTIVALHDSISLDIKYLAESGHPNPYAVSITVSYTPGIPEFTEVYEVDKVLTRSELLQLAAVHIRLGESDESVKR